MKNGVLFSTTNSGPVVDTSYQYINWSKEESFIENEFYIPYSGDMRIEDSIFCRGRVESDSFSRDVRYDKSRIPSKIVSMLQGEMGYCTERLHNGEVVYISLAYSISIGETEDVVLPDGTVETRHLVPGNYHETYCFVPNRILSDDTVHNTVSLSIIVPSDLDINLTGRDRIFEGGFNHTYPMMVILNDNKEYCVDDFDNLNSSEDSRDFLFYFIKKEPIRYDFDNDDLLERLSEYYSNKGNSRSISFEDWNSLYDWNKSKGKKHNM